MLQITCRGLEQFFFSFLEVSVCTPKSVRATLVDGHANRPTWGEGLLVDDGRMLQIPGQTGNVQYYFVYIMFYELMVLLAKKIDNCFFFVVLNCTENGSRF